MDEKKPTRGRKRTSEQAPATEQDPRRKVGLLLSAEIDFKLMVYARKRGKDRSTVVEEMLREKLSGVTISFRGKSSEEGEAA